MPTRCRPDADPMPTRCRAQADAGPDAGRKPEPPPGAALSVPRLVTARDLDDTSLFYNRHRSSVAPLSAAGRARLDWRNLWFLLAQTCTMGLLRDVAMGQDQFNGLFVVFYVGYLCALWPGAAVAQRVGHKPFITGSLLLWALLLGLHPLARTSGHMVALRFLLGMTESQIVPSTAVLHQAFFPPKKSPWVQLLWWAAGSFANVLLTMVAYRLIQDDAHAGLVGGLRSWKWLHIICAILTLVVAIVLIVFLPNSPVDAKWLSTEDKVHTIALTREAHTGISNSTFKWSQVKECFLDLKSWLFIVHMFFNELPNNTSQQLPLILVGFGFTPAQSALLNVAKPLWGCFFILVSAAMLYGTEIGVGYTCVISYTPCFVGGIIMMAAPWSSKPSYLLGLSWAGTTTNGYTKLCLTSTCVVAAAVANMVSPEFWQEKYKPRCFLPWACMTAFWFLSSGMCLMIRFYLARQNRIRAMKLGQRVVGSTRDALDTGGGILRLSDEDLDQTDRQNLKFVYPI
ncbi:major facilitator superfamily protein [Hirsutella rhossiliensis]|uniref:Major facilitator superfamily domain-containing protein n=1 Tax=Hirsutella rhossiliensis TaxID=111463 RepID=A0A9P8MUT2_9HYPO|nr:major facilitator superfamily domain-containing protein [Hirsutella rhossiliensis]KAH0961802.1 major facilitator superfamily domain-containing protein [Hirsutella rhossiliensis]